jgi:DNA-binding beta-propeller fold protein YncE
MTPAFVATGVFPTSIAIRNDDSFMFVANYTSGTLSEYGVSPGDGALTVQPTVTTVFPTPWGVAVK